MQPGEIARRRRQDRRLDLDVVETHHRVDRERRGASSALRTTWRWTWLSGGTSMSDVARTRARGTTAGDRRAGRCARRSHARRRRRAVRCDGDDVIPCFGNEPSPGVTWQRPQMPRPPQTESMSTPRRARSLEDGRAGVHAAAAARWREDDERLDAALAMRAPTAATARRSRRPTSRHSARRPAPAPSAAVDAPASPGLLAVGCRARGVRGSSGRTRRRCPSGRRPP